MTQARVPLIVPGTNPALAKLEADIEQARGRISPLYQALLNSPAIAEGWEAMLTAVRVNASLPAVLRELIILRIATLNRAPYEFEAHIEHARRAGISDETINALRGADFPGGLSEPEALVIRLTDAMTREIEVPDSLMQVLQQRFNAEMLVELVATVAAYNMVSRFLVALRIGH